MLLLHRFEHATSLSDFISLNSLNVGTVLVRTFQIEPKLCTSFLHKLDPRTKLWKKKVEYWLPAR